MTTTSTPADRLANLSRLRHLLASGGARMIRRAARLTLKEIGDELGVDQSTVWRWEHGQRTPHGRVATDLLDILDRLVKGAGR